MMCGACLARPAAPALTAPHSIGAAYADMQPWSGTSQNGDLNGDGNVTSVDVVIALDIAVSGKYVPEAISTRTAT